MPQWRRLTAPVTLQSHVDMKSSVAELPDDMAIGDLAALFGLAPHVLRHWEAVGLLSPRRLANGRRRYGPDHAMRVALIQRGKEAGFGLDQLRELVEAADRTTRRGVFTRHHAALEQRIARAQEAKTMVEHALDCTADDVMTCPAFRRLLLATIPGESPAADWRTVCPRHPGVAATDVAPRR